MAVCSGWFHFVEYIQNRNNAKFLNIYPILSNMSLLRSNRVTRREGGPHLPNKKMVKKIHKCVQFSLLKTQVKQTPVLWHLQTLNFHIRMLPASEMFGSFMNEWCVIPPSCGDTWISRILKCAYKNYDTLIFWKSFYFLLNSSILRYFCINVC